MLCLFPLLVCFIYDISDVVEYWAVEFGKPTNWLRRKSIIFVAYEIFCICFYEFLIFNNYLFIFIVTEIQNTKIVVVEKDDTLILYQSS